MNCQKLKYVLHGLNENQHVETLDFSHCTIGDEGVSAIAKFIIKRENLRNLILNDNKFGKYKMV